MKLTGQKKLKEKRPRSNFVVGVTIGLIVVVSVAFFFAPVRQAQAFPGEAMAAAIWRFARDQAVRSWDLAKDAAKEAYKITKDVAFKNALRIYLTRIAEETATYIATGDPGQKPLFLEKPGKYFVDVGDAALGDYLDTVSSGALGASLCDIGPVKIKIDLAYRAEISPNFCTDGCQRAYEKKLNEIDDHILIRDELQKTLDQFRTDQLSAQTQCVTYPNQAACTADAVCDWCFAASGACAADVCGPDPALSRAMDNYEIYSGAFTGDADEQAAIIEEFCTSTGSDDLALCVRNLTTFIETHQQQAEFTRQRCVQLCTGAKRSAKCTFTQIKERSIAAYKQSEFSATYPEIFNAKQNEVGQYLLVYESARAEAEQTRQEARDTLTFDEVGPIQSIISASIITPSTLTRSAAEKPVEEAGTDITTRTDSPIADAIGVFTDTLTKKLLERIFKRDKGFVGPQTGRTIGTGGYNSGGIAAAKAQFAKEFTPNLTRQGSANVDSVSRLVEDGVIDQEFAEAIQQELTVEKAVELGKLHGDWWFGYNQNREIPATGNNGYPATSFPILRTNRIVPVGWEIAAEYISNANYEQGQYTLSQMLDEYDNEDSPYYRLVDPKWVLKAPLSICAREGYSGDLAEGSCQASQVVTSSIEVNDDNPGCIEGEHDTNGDGACDENDGPIYENTCQREQVCVDPQTCIRETPDGQGCEEYGYCTKEKPLWRFQGTACNAEFASCQGYITSDNRQVSYLTDTLDSEFCSADNVGCQRYCYTDTATGQYLCDYDQANQKYTHDLIRFDRDVVECSSSEAGCSELYRMTQGANILPNASFELFTTPFPVEDQAEFSGWEIGGSSQSCGAQGFADRFTTQGSNALRLQYLAACGGDPRQYARTTVDTGRSISDRTFTVSFDVRALNAPCTGDVSVTAPGFAATFTPTYQSDYQRLSTTVTFAGVISNSFSLTFNAVQNCPLVIDGVKIEESASATSFANYGANNLMMKIPPAHLNCIGDPATDSPDCGQYAAVCSADDVGCRSFTPAGGGVVIPGKITDPSVCDFANDPTACNQCPIAFVGCSAMRELDLTTKVPAWDDPARISAGFASIVPQTGTQCSAAYVGCEEYTNLEEVAQGGEGLEYFTKVRQCVNSDDPNKAFYYAWEGSASSGYELVRYQLKQSNLGAGVNRAPCTNLDVTSNPNAACVDGAPGNPVNNCQAEWPSNPNCVQFYDEAGNAHYRYLEEVIFVTDECKAHRNSLDGNTYYFDGTKSTTCPATFAGCREYHGAATNNTRTVFLDDFESVSNPLNGWDGAGGSTTVTTESLTFGGHSMTVGGAFTHKDIAVTQGRSYIVSFWAKTINPGNGPLNVWLENAPNDRFFTWDGASTNLTITPEWQYYRLGPVEVDWAPDPTYIAMRSIAGVYVDNIQLIETTEDIFLIRNSASSCTGFEGCKEYADQTGQRHFLKGFERLCNSNDIGCEALINTHNSVSPFETVLDPEQMYPQGNGAYAPVVPDDSVIFLVNDPTKYCSAGSRACMALGSMTVDQDLEVTSINTVYLKNDPDAFSTILCSESAVGCQEFKEIEDQSSLAYFKDPRERVCEYRENVTGGTGWYTKGTNDPCNVSWAKECPIEQSTCREYFAPRIYPNPATPGEQSYYYLDSSISRDQCPSGIDPRSSCLGFQDAKSGNNIARPRFDQNDLNVVLAQSCNVCSADAATCGRNGNSPCCNWSSLCSPDRTTGTDDVAPYFCVQGATEDVYQNCKIEIQGSFAVPNHTDPAQATNCGQAGQPACFDMNGAATADPADDWNVANEANRNCADYACTVNTIIPVTPDRVCEEWLSCTNEMKVTRNGIESTVCLERSLENSDGFIDDNIGDNKQENLVKSSPAEVKDLANYSGLVSAGILRTGLGNLVDGLYPYSQFEEDGNEGAFLEVPNGDFEGYKISVSESPQQIRTSSGAGGPWINESEFDWKATRDAAGIQTAQLQIEKTDTADQFSNQYLSIVSRSTGENGARALLNSNDEIREDAEYYMLSFKARKVGTLAQGVKFSLFQPNVGDIFLDLSAGGYQFTTDWKEYIVKLYNNPGANIDPYGDNAELRVLHRSGSVPSEALNIDDVSLKPVLHIQDAKALVPESGLYGTYFQAKMVPAPGSQQGLTAQYWDDIPSVPSSICQNPPTCSLLGPANMSVPPPAADLTFHMNQVNYPYTAFSNRCSGGSRNGDLCFVPGDCPAGACIAGSPNTEYSLRFTGGIYVENSDENRFYFNHDDGAKLFVEDLNAPVLDEWYDSPCVGSDDILQDMPEGWHPVKIEWYNKSGAGFGGLQFGWHPGSGGLPYLDRNADPASTEFDEAVCGVTACGGGLYPNICNNGKGGDIVPADRLITALTIDTNTIFSDGFLISSGTDAEIGFDNFNARLQEKANRGDAVGVRWVGEILADSTQDYSFAIRHKDGFKLYIDDFDTPIAEDWAEAAVNTDTVTHNMTQGWHQIQIEFFKGLDAGADTAVMMFGWNQPGSTAMGGGYNVVPESHLRSFPPAPTGFVARECRSYPQSDSLVCNYEDPQSGVVYLGWKGYCVERDPRDPKVCLNWWPVDVLSGDTNVFADQETSLTRSPLFMCAETEKKDPPMAVPRYICLSTYLSDSDGGPEPRCHVAAIVDDLLPAGYELTAADGWVYGSGTDPGTTQNCDLYPGNASANCCVLENGAFNNAACTSSQLLQSFTNDGDTWVINQNAFDGCMNELKKYYANIYLRIFTDDGGRDSEGCGADNWGDNNGDCDNDNPNCYYRQLTDVSTSCGMFTCDFTGNNWVGSGYFWEYVNWNNLLTFPLQCKTLIQVTRSDGDSTPWTAKVQSGTYALPPGQPTLYSQGTACAPWGAAPVISKPSDVYNCIPNPDDPPPSGCTTALTGFCEKLVTTESGECILAPMEIYHPNNPDNNQISQICSETRLGGGFFSCGTSGLCKTCSGGDRSGLLCQCDPTMTATGVCPDTDADGLSNVNDCPGEGNPLQTIDPTKTVPTCEQTFGRGETLGDPDHTYYTPGVPAAPLPYEDVRNGISRIKQLFARSYGFWTWDDTAQRYVRRDDLKDWLPPVDAPNPPEAPTGVGNTARCPSETTPDPADNTHVADPNMYCGIRPTVTNISLQGGQASGGDIILSGTEREINLTFNYTIDTEQAPLKNITIHWGDSDPKSFYKSGAASKTYRCNSTDSVNCSPESAAVDCPGSGVLQNYPDAGDPNDPVACIYTNYPKIQIEDNWGWCSIRAGALGYGCYGKTGANALPEHWDNYSGRIVVLP